jgi:hypothetical protein
VGYENIEIFKCENEDEEDYNSNKYVLLDQDSAEYKALIDEATVLVEKRKVEEENKKKAEELAEAIKKKNEQENDYCEKNGMLLTLISMRGDIACPIGQFQPYK